MTPELIPYLLLGFLGTMLAVVSQTLLKWEAGKPHESVVREYLNPGVIAAYALLAVSMLFPYFVYKKLPVSMTAVWDSSSYIFVTLFGALFFHERITKRKLLALALILTGILVFTL